MNGMGRLYDYKKEDYLFYLRNGYRIVIKGDLICIEEVFVTGSLNYVIYDSEGSVVESNCISDKYFRALFDRYIEGILYLKNERGFNHKNSLKVGSFPNMFVLDGWYLKKETSTEFSIKKNRAGNARTYFKVVDGKVTMLSNAQGRSKWSMGLFLGLIEKCCLLPELEELLEKEYMCG